MAKLLQALKDPRTLLHGLITHGFFNWCSDTVLCRILYYTETGKFLHLNPPRLLNEKLQWLKLHNRKEEFTTLADKVLVKKYVANQVGDKYIIPTIAVWDTPEQIDWDILPNQFVLKVNHNSGGNYICRDKNNIDKDRVKQKLAKALKQDYYKVWREWPYKNIERKILAEKFIENSDGSPIVDYKFYCYGGKPRYFMYSVGEACHQVRNHKFDMDCNDIDYLFKKNPKLKPDEIKLPANFFEMKYIVEKLCAGFQHIRIDLYNVDGKIYFGEMTFFSGGGIINIDNADFSQKLADYIDISKI